MKNTRELKMNKPKCTGCDSNLLTSELKEYEQKRQENMFKGIYEEPKILCSTCKRRGGLE